MGGRSDHPVVWPFPTYRGQPYRPPRRPRRSGIDFSACEEALI